MKHRKITWMMAALTAVIAVPETTQDALQTGFKNPPMSARPLVWWHWMGGNVSKEGALLNVLGSPNSGLQTEFDTHNSPD